MPIADSDERLSKEMASLEHLVVVGRMQCLLISKHF